MTDYIDAATLMAAIRAAVWAHEYELELVEKQ